MITLDAGTIILIGSILIGVFAQGIFFGKDHGGSTIPHALILIQIILMSIGMILK